MSNKLDPKHHVVLVSDSGPIPSYYVRFLDPIGLVTQNYNVMPVYEAGAEVVAGRADLLVVQRWLGDSTLRIVEAAKERGVPIVYETDDNLLDLPKASGMVMSEGHIRNIESVLSMADLVVCSTNSLSKEMIDRNENIVVIGNYGLDKPAVNVGGDPHLAVVNTDYFKLGDSKASFFKALSQAIEDLKYKITFFGSVDAEMTAMHARFPEAVSIVDGFIDNRSAFLDLLAARGVNVAAVPLDDTDQHLIKSDIKFLDFASLGVPAIFNNSRVYASVRHEVDGYLTEDSQAGWFEGLEYFAHQANRKRCGAAARKVVVETRGISQYADRLSEAYARVLDKKMGKSALPPIDRDRSGLFWQAGHLVLLHDGVKRHVTTKPLIADLVDAGFGFVDPRPEEYLLQMASKPLSNPAQVRALPPLARRTSSRMPISPASGRPLTISWIVPGLIIGGGGHRNIIRCAYHLEKLGHRVSLHFIDSADSGEVVREQVREHFYPFDGHVGLLGEDLPPSDIVFATHWTTVAHAERFSDRIGEIVYFVQDFEPYFYSMGSEYVMAENTYRKGYYAVTSGIWCEHFLRNAYGGEADHFQFPIDREIYFNRSAVRRKDRVIFFAKPEMPRRCYELGVQALRALHKLRPDIEIVFFGSSHQRPVDFPVLQLGMLPGPHDLAKLYNEATVGLAFSTTNPSLVPYEMMACGLPVVDLARPGNETNYDNGFDLARLVDPDPLKMAQEIAAFISDSDDLKGRSERGLAFAATFPEEEGVGRRIEGLLMKRVQAWDDHALRRATSAPPAIAS
ncbi:MULTISPECIES: glycosyltransferase [unclassified Brevundimonas]|uniref:rhamnosyltransferase WsaF family glycosyltransferase n=1 Tax=unclassified Brevundimonas TaxID=2622653 RepID=UPI0025BE22D5|nr:MULTISPECIES: glycosyltransferase [unclassified Brevundimonas]